LKSTRALIIIIASLIFVGASLFSGPKVNAIVQPAACLSDYNLDGIVNIGDFNVFAQHYRQDLYDCSKDIVGGNCKLDIVDFQALASVYRTQQCRNTAENRGFVLKVDPAFSESKLPESMKIWHQRLINSFTNVSVYPNPYTAAASRDAYTLGRTVNNHQTALLAALRATGDPAILAEIDRIMEIARSTLADVHPECSTFNLCAEQQDGYLNWTWLHDPQSSLFGSDTHQMDEMLTHSMVASAAYAFFVNKDFDQKYLDHANFWIDYLENHFETKIRTRKNNSTAITFIDENLTHPYIQFARFDYYMYKMTGKAKYMDDYKKREKVAKEKIFITRILPAGEAFVWEHRMPWIYNTAGQIVNGGAVWLGCQSTSYSVYTFGGTLDLELENAPFYRDSLVKEKFSRTMSNLIIPNNAVISTILTPDVCGGVTVPGEGISSTGSDDDNFGRTIIWTHVGQSIWDKSDKLKTLFTTLYTTDESNQNIPKQIFIPAYMLAVERVRN